MVVLTVPATATLVRRDNGRSGLDEVTVGDRITADGSFERGSTTMFDAQRLKDWSIQRAYTRVVGSVATVQNGVVTLRVARGRSEHRAYWHGDDVWVTVPSSAIVASGSGAVTVNAVRPGMRVLVLGLYDRASRSLRAGRVCILSAPRQHDDRGVHRQNDDPAATATPRATGTPVDDHGGPRRHDDPGVHL
jgi:hypothetical protein